MSARTAGGAIFVLGGARSGKSAYAEGLVEQSGLEPVYLATGRAFDPEMEIRIAHHRERRGPAWNTIEEPLDLAGVLGDPVCAGKAVLVDCLTLWLTNLIMENRDIAAATVRLLQGLAAHDGLVVVVSNEVGHGIVPENELARAFRDHAGRLHQQVAGLCDTVWFVVAGLPQKLKG